MLEPGSSARPVGKAEALECMCDWRRVVKCVTDVNLSDTAMAPWIKPAATKSVATLGKIVIASVGLTMFYAGMERAIDDKSAVPVPHSTLKQRKSGTW